MKKILLLILFPCCGLFVFSQTVMPASANDATSISPTDTAKTTASVQAKSGGEFVPQQTVKILPANAFEEPVMVSDMGGETRQKTEEKRVPVTNAKMGR